MLQTPSSCTLSEAKRVARLEALSVLDTGPEETFDAITRAAAILCGVPIALVTLVDDRRQWFKSNFGLSDVTEMPRDVAFCTHALTASTVLVVPDTTKDPRFMMNPLVTGDSHVRFYAGAPIRLLDGHTMGTLCVIDRCTRDLTDTQISVLQALADGVARSLEARESAIAALTAAKQAETRVEHLYTHTPAMLYSVDAEGRILTVSETWLTELGYTRDQVIGRKSTDFVTDACRKRVYDSLYPEFYKTGYLKDVELQMIRGDGEVLDILVSAVLERDAAGAPQRNIAIVENVTARRRAERELFLQRERMAGILEGTNAGTWEWNVQTGETLLNERWAEMIGYALGELSPTMSWFEHMHPDDHAKVKQCAQAHLRGESDRFEVDLRMRHRDGHYVWVHDRGCVTTWSDPHQPLLMQGVRLDISARKESEQVLRASQNFLARTGQVAGVGGWELEIESQKLTWSDQTCRLHDVEPGYQPTLAEAISFYEPEARTIITSAVQSAIADGTPWDLELKFVSAKGRSFWGRAVGSVEIEAGKPVRLVGAFQDITARKEIEHRLEQSQNLLQVTLESIGDAVITTDTNGKVQWLNPAAEHLTGWLKDDARGRPITQVFVIINQTTRKALPDPIAACLADGKAVALSNHTTLISRDGREFGIEDTASPIRSSNGDLHGAVLVFRDVSEARRLNDALSYRASHDVLTGLPNRLEFESRLGRVLRRTAEDTSQNALLYIDLDQFKVVNDACGHLVGDQLLCEVSSLFKGCVREHDTVARLGGDEFGLILEYVSASHAFELAQKICKKMEELRFSHDGRSFRIGASIGLVPLDDRWINMTAVLQAADAACYAAKEAGRNRVHVWFDTDTAKRA